MNAIEFLKSALEFTERFGTPMLEDMREAALVQPTPNGGNHALWIIGHLAGSEAAMCSMVTGEPSPLETWQEPFAPGTEPTTDSTRYPSYDEVLTTFRDTRARTMALLDSMDEAMLDQSPKGLPPGMEQMFQTNAQVLMLILIHQQFHMGQLADARRAAGRKPLFSPEPAAEATS